MYLCMIDITQNHRTMLSPFRVIGLPPEEEWPTDVTLSRKNFSPLMPRPITDFVAEINEQGAELLLVRCGYDLKMIVQVYPDL